MKVKSHVPCVKSAGSLGFETFLLQSKDRHGFRAQRLETRLLESTRVGKYRNHHVETARQELCNVLLVVGEVQTLAKPI